MHSSEGTLLGGQVHVHVMQVRLRLPLRERSILVPRGVIHSGETKAHRSLCHGRLVNYQNLQPPLQNDPSIQSNPLHYPLQNDGILYLQK
jgi:hypothetical protein